MKGINKSVLVTFSIITLLIFAATVFHVGQHQKQTYTISADSNLITNYTSETPPTGKITSKVVCKTKNDTTFVAASLSERIAFSPALSVFTDNDFTGFFVEQLLLVFKQSAK